MSNVFFVRPLDGFFFGFTRDDWQMSPRFQRYFLVQILPKSNRIKMTTTTVPNPLEG